MPREGTSFSETPKASRPIVCRPHLLRHSGCQIDQVNIVALAKLQTVTKFTDSRLDFVKSFTFNLGTDDLVKFGADQSFDAGQEAFICYSKLFDGNDIPLTNDTLDDSQCSDTGDSTEEVSDWEAVYATPIAKRLNTAASSANLTTPTSSTSSACALSTRSSTSKKACGALSLNNSRPLYLGLPTTYIAIILLSLSSWFLWSPVQPYPSLSSDTAALTLRAMVFH
ncbi:hypothetical protein BC835DRAFT_1461145 [Cytidiella melzeri]|nr:hypothetical protein BC835DRAFT_1461145 [Cytidiella melzeri]